MPKQQNQAKGSSKKVGRNKDKCAHYRAMHHREKNKVRRVLRASGVEEAKRWAKENNVSGYLKKVLRGEI